jgi:hypothetical protein
VRSSFFTLFMGNTNRKGNTSSRYILNLAKMCTEVEGWHYLKLLTKMEVQDMQNATIKRNFFVL